MAEDHENRSVLQRANQNKGREITLTNERAGFVNIVLYSTRPWEISNSLKNVCILTVFSWLVMETGVD